ncbi:DUF1345 domain-containing protein [Curtobacterium flaccumfaciens]|uniref:DUF1345 domain-containing protein n=1 Tax=Curtobacterium flaccumfaciens TaxID=2035 RepID=UPI001BDEBFC3|nr:DUF1345 domain-containing protein [Curtobacterium flaccumfaciens]MBT1671879.1 DUF1345 domain-containing protein [Curtobacterium flaccumfaciens pv. flaccumfaciens]
MTPTRTRPRHEHRAPVAIAVLVNLALSLFLPDEVLFFPSWVVPVLGVLLLTPLIVFNPRRLTRETTWSRWLSFALAALLTVASQLTVVRTITELLGGHADGAAVLLTALQVWVSTIIVFGLVYWELDRGGPVARRRPELWSTAEADFQFPQETDLKTAGWRPVYLDYLYVAMTNMMAFSPTDTMPMTVRAKMIMAYQALSGFILLALVISRAVNIIS